MVPRSSRTSKNLIIIPSASEFVNVYRGNVIQTPWARNARDERNTEGGLKSKVPGNLARGTQLIRVVGGDNRAGSLDIKHRS